VIAKLKGLVDSVGDGRVVIDVNGVGYLVFCPARTLRDLPPPGGPATLLIDTHVREDHIHLYGFSDSLERDWFRLLQTVQGVGARVAIAILSVLGPAQLAEAIAAQDKAPVTEAPGVGAKLAQRIVSELKDKVPSLVAVMSVGATADAGETKTARGLMSDAAADAVSALVNLGYRRVEAFTAVAAVAKDKSADLDVQALIRGALRELAQAGKVA
jgi:Holliday junction DNA helicase RuvA